MTSNKQIFTQFIFLMILQKSEESFLRSPSLVYRLIRGNSTYAEVSNYKNTCEEDLEYLRYKKNSEEIKRRWIKYYTCLLRMQYRELKPEIRLLYEGQHTQFVCKCCPRPFQNYDELEWKYKPLTPNDVYDFEFLDLTNEMVLTRNKTLRIFNVVKDFAGVYACFQKQNVISVYILEVSTKNLMERVSAARTGDIDYIMLNGEFFSISYQWARWTECSSCGGIGRKYKYGTCFISTADEKNERLLPEALDFYEYKMKLSKNASSDCYGKNNDMENVKKFLTGIPCASRYLSPTARMYIQEYAPIKVVVKHCLESCYDYQIFEVLDKSGRVIERANNSAGVYSVFQKIPKLNPDIERRSVTAEFGQNIIIQCPGTMLSTIPVTWKINDKVIFPQVVARQSKGRFIVDLINRIRIKKLRLKDSHIYSCWQRNHLVGTVNLIVEKKFRTSLDHHVILIILVIVIGICLLVGKKLLAEELRHRRK